MPKISTPGDGRIPASGWMPGAPPQVQASPSVEPPPLFLALEAEEFAAQALAARDPALRGRPFVVINQDPDSHKTVVIACPRAARELGLRVGMLLAAVRRRFRRITTVFRDQAGEDSVSDALRGLCLSYTPEFDVARGRAVLDMMGTPGARALAMDALAARFRNDALAVTGLEELSVGAAATRLMAKVMARQALERGLGVGICLPGREAETLAPLPPECLPGLSPQCRDRIRRYALHSVGQIQSLGRKALETRFGDEGDKLFTVACGLDLEESKRPRTALQAETVFLEDIHDEDVLARQVRLTADKLVFRLRASGALAGKVAVILRYADGKSTRKTLVVHPPTADFVPLSELALSGFLALHVRRVSLRSMSLSVPKPARATGQTDLFETDAVSRQRAIGEAMAKIRKRSGFGAILSAANIDAAE